MGRRNRTMIRRMSSLSLGTIWLLAFVVSAGASADSADFLPASSGEGWYWESRPTTDVPGDDAIGDAFNYQVPGQGTPSSKAFAPDHLYVGWDGVKQKAEMFSGVAFDLSAIPVGSRITRFAMTLVWHPAGGSHQNTPNYDAITKQGVIACPWPDFIAGAPAVAATSAPADRDCTKQVAGNVTMPTETPVSTTVVSWTFDLSPMASEWADGENPAISLEPKALTAPDQSWQTSFHASTYKELDAAGNPVAKPGVLASVTWTPPDSSGGSGGGDDSFTTEIGGDIASFGGSGGLADQLAPPPDAPLDEDPTVLAAGISEGKSAAFWDIPMLAKIVALLGFLLISGAGWVVQSDPGGDRPPGAASALMRGSPNNA